MRRMYSIIQLSELIHSLIADGLLKDVDVRAKTFEQSEYSYTREVTLTSATGLTIENVYNRFAVLNSIMYLIVNFTLKNETESNIIVGSGYSYIGISQQSIDEKIASKIYDISGKTIAEVGTNGTLIASEPCHVFKAKTLENTTEFAQARLSLVNRNVKNQCSVQVALNGVAGDRITLAPNDEIYITGRLALSLI